MTSWNDLQKPRAKSTEEELNIDKYADLAAACFTTPAGRLFLEFLHHHYVDAVSPMNTHESALREMNAKRHLVREFEAKTALGIANRSKAQK